MSVAAYDLLSLADWRRRVAECYAAVRADPDPEHAWQRWCDLRRELYTTHEQSPVPREKRGTYRGPFMHAYDPAVRVTATVTPLPPISMDVITSAGSTTRFLRFAEAAFTLRDQVARLELLWLDAYGGGIYLAFRDATSGTNTYGGGRYLLDTVKGADLGGEGDGLILDFNFAYQPSCSYDPQWSCPLPPPSNHLAFPVPAGERLS